MKCDAIMESKRGAVSLQSSLADGSSRRVVVSGLVATVVAGASTLLRLTGAAAAVYNNGIVGGGMVRWDGGEANVVLYGFRLLEDEQTLAVAGGLQWVDLNAGGGALTLESTTITNYGPVPDQAEARELSGRIRANGAGDHAFTLRVIDGGSIGSGADQVALRVGGEGDAFRYTAAGRFVSGGVQRVRYEVPSAATPTPSS